MESGTEKSYLGKLPDVPRRRRRVRRRVEGKIVITYLDEGVDVTTTTVQGGNTQASAGPSGLAPTPRRRPPPKRKPGRGRKPGRKVKFAEEQAAATVTAPPAEPVKVGEEPVKVLEVAKGEVEIMELDPATTEGELKPTTEIDVEMEKVEEKEEREALKSLQG